MAEQDKQMGEGVAPPSDPDAELRAAVRAAVEDGGMPAPINAGGTSGAAAKASMPAYHGGDQVHQTGARA
ncbi:MAG: hypothetical protein KDD53_11785 [Bdellovibrionales bacterium]|nr:hypothetical protein [Bdellovibrionales bacterium]